MTAASTSLLEATAEVARLAGKIALRHFRAGLPVERKADGSPVTAADREAERAARNWIGTRFPHDGIIGEELGIQNPNATRRWFIDPIDGTKTFVRGVPLWGTLVAVAEGESILAGAASFPALGEDLAAAPGAGCWWNGVDCRVSECAELDRATAVTTDERFPHSEGQYRGWLRLAARVEVSRTWGDCYGYLLVATGRAEVMVDGTLSPWDAAALMPIIEEAGGVFTNWAGARTAFGGSAVATNRALATEARLLLALREEADA